MLTQDQRTKAISEIYHSLRVVVLRGRPKIKMASCDRFTNLIDTHLEDQRNDRKWYVGPSKYGGRGVFAKTDLNAGDVIFREKPILIGLTARKESKLYFCTVCFKILDKIDFVCKLGCSLPVCDICATSDQHKQDCDLFRLWEPIEPNQVDRYSLRLLPIARGLFLSSTQRDLVYQMQANTDPQYKNEVKMASKCFKNFPSDRDTLEYFYRIISVFNTNAFEAIGQKEKGTALRGLYPLGGTMNHMCTPNTSHTFDDDNSIVVKATKFISKGTEVTTSYTKILWNNLSRRMFLNLTKQFICQCERCMDVAENKTFLCAQLCRNGDCRGIVMPIDNTLFCWKCLTCQNEYDSTHATKMNDFALAAINSKVSGNSIKDILLFINERIPKFCPSSNQLVLEAKLNVIWRMNKSSEDFTVNEYLSKIQYCEEILEILDKLDAGESMLKVALFDEIKNTKAIINNKK